MKKSILFVTKDLGSGGAEKSLVSLLSQIDFKSYNVDLLRLGEGDFFVNSIPDEVNILEVSSKTNVLLCKPAKESMLILLRERKFISCIFEFLGHGIYKIISKHLGLNAKILKWKLVSFLIPRMNKEYDVAIAYNYDYPIHFLIDKVRARKKIGWIHGNYKLTKSIAIFDKYYFSRLNNLVTVSNICKDILVSVFPYFSHKISVIENIISPKIINNMANQEVGIHKSKNEFVIVTVARLSPEKGIDLAIQASSILVREGYNFKWLVIGEGLERKNLEQLIIKYGLKDKFILLGEKTNPYPFIKEADIYAQPSITEGKSIAIEEAKALGKPIVVTNYSTVTDQIKNTQNGLIVSIDANDISAGIIKLLSSPKLRNEFTKELLNGSIGNEHEINKLYEIINH